MAKPQTSPFFSVIIPTLGKVDQWLGAVHSVLAQSFDNFEIIAIDSGAENTSRPEIEKLADPRIIYINTASGNPRLNWDTGFRNSKGNYIVWMDDDNFLLPHALTLLYKLITDHGQPEMVTAEHMHYRSKTHYIPRYQNQLVINLPLFTGKTEEIDPKDIVRRLMNWPQKTAVRARFHMTETAVKRSVVESLLSKIGEINFETTSTHSLRLGVLALSDRVFVSDTPIALVGQSGNALTDTWPKIDSPVLKEMRYRLELSPLHVLTYANYRLENMLRTKALLGDTLADIGPNMPQFLATYRRELIAFNQTWSAWFKNWKEYRIVLASYHEPEYDHIKKSQRKFMVIAFGIQVVRKLHLYNALKYFLREHRISHNRATIITLDSYGVTDMMSCAKALPQVIEKELGIPYAEFITSKQ